MESNFALRGAKLILPGFIVDSVSFSFDLTEPKSGLPGVNFDMMAASLALVGTSSDMAEVTLDRRDAMVSGIFLVKSGVGGG